MSVTDDKIISSQWGEKTEDSVNAWPRCLEDDCQVAFDLELHGTAPNWPRSPEKDRFPTVFLLLSFLDMVNLVMQNLPKKT